MRGVIAALSLANSKSPLNNAPESEYRIGFRTHADAARLLARDAGHPEHDGIREAAEKEEEEEREGQMGKRIINRRRVARAMSSS